MYFSLVETRTLCGGILISINSRVYIVRKLIIGPVFGVIYTRTADDEIIDDVLFDRLI